MEDRIKVLEEQIQALRDLISIKDQIINTLREQHAQQLISPPQPVFVPYIPPYQPQLPLLPATPLPWTPMPWNPGPYIGDLVPPFIVTCDSKPIIY